MTTYYFPPGMILPFSEPCPGGWTEVTNMRSRFPKGSTNFGDRSGSTTHTHTFNPPSVDSGLAGTRGDKLCIGGAPKDYSEYNHLHPYDRDSVVTGSASNMPPYVTVTFCQKT